MLSHFRKPIPDDSYDVFEYDSRVIDFLQLQQIVDLAVKETGDMFQKWDGDFTVATLHWSKLYPSSVKLENGMSAWVLYQIFMKDEATAERYLAFVCYNDEGVRAVRQAESHYRKSFSAVLEMDVDDQLRQLEDCPSEWDPDYDPDEDADPEFPANRF